MSADQSELKGKLAEKAVPGTAVEKADERPTAATIVRRAIENQSTAFRAVMPKGVDSERFGRLVLTAVKATPQLMECFTTEQGQVSVLLAAMQAAAVGLEPNTPTQQCWLLPRKNKGVTECQLSIGYRGWLKLVRRSGTLQSIVADVVHENDVFHWSRGLERDEFEHVQFDGDGEPGPLTHAYAIARFKDGGYQFVVLNRRQVEARRASSDSFKFGKDYSPWTKWPEEMWRKTAIRALVPYLDLDTDAAHMAVKDESSLRLTDDGAIDVEEMAELSAPAAGEAKEPEPPPVEDTEPARRAMLAAAGKAFPLPDLKGKAQTEARTLLRHAIAFCELGEHKSSTAMTVAELRRVEARLMEVERGAITVLADDDGRRVVVRSGGQEIPVTFEQIGVEG